MANVQARLHYLAEGTVRASPEALWPLLADTERIGRTFHTPPIHYVTRPRPEGGSDVVVEYRLGRLGPLGRLPLLRWDEPPSEWSYPRHYSIVRNYHWGPVRQFRLVVELDPAPEGSSRVRVHTEFVPRDALAALFLRFVVGARISQRTLALCSTFERYLQGQAKAPSPKLQPRRSWRRRLRALRRASQGAPVAPAAPAAQAAATAGLPLLPGPPRDSWDLLERSSPKEHVARLRRHLEEAPDEDVVKMRPFALADAWGCNRRALLVLFLRATTLGLLEMTWEVLCPNCRLRKASYGSLADLKLEAHCDYCNLTYDGSFDQNVEVRFTVAPSLRRVEDRIYCVSSPLSRPHLVAQLRIPGGETARMAQRLAPGNYRVRSLQSRGSCSLVVAPAGAGGRAGANGKGTGVSAWHLDLEVREHTMHPAELQLAGPVLELMAYNSLASELTLELVRSDWPDTIATAALVSTFQEFRDLFSSEVLAPGLQVAIQRLAFLFTDLSGSTALYQSAGQARAFRIVQDHFRILLGVIAEHGGATVKTIGDAVMAAFPSGLAALRAALAIQRAIRTLDTGGTADPERFVKIGIHQGPCLAATANDRLDYFGTTVNVAARVVHEARGGEITLSEELRADPQVARFLENRLFRLEPSLVHLRGIRGPARIYRLTNPAASDGP